MRVGGKQTKPLSIAVLCDWAERVQPTTTQRPYVIGLNESSQHPRTFKGDGYRMAL